ncbi:MAG: hypothetical protein WCC11_10260 [Gammaproteobacteria bacterium]
MQLRVHDVPLRSAWSELVGLAEALAQLMTVFFIMALFVMVAVLFA